MIFNVDFDGVIISEDFENRFFNVGKYFVVTIDEYIRTVAESPLPPINVYLLAHLDSLRQDGNVIRLLTNRNDDLRNHTINTLGDYKNIFDSFTFCSGMKKNYKVEGIMIDNEKKYLTCGNEGGIHYIYK